MWGNKFNLSDIQNEQLDTIKQWVIECAQKMVHYRTQQFSELEIVLGFISFFQWFHGLSCVPKENMKDYVDNSNETAKQAATNFFFYSINNHHAKDYLYTYYPKQIISRTSSEYSENALEDNSLERAVVLLTRGLAYSFTGRFAPIRSEKIKEALLYHGYEFSLSWAIDITNKEFVATLIEKNKLLLSAAIWLGLYEE